jgi:hypothetical protein
MKNKQQQTTAEKYTSRRFVLLKALKQGRLDGQKCTKPWENDKFIQNIGWKT